MSELFADGWEEIVVPARITGLTLFREWLIIATVNGVFLAPSCGLETSRYVDDHLFVKITPEARESIYIMAAGHLPRRLESVSLEDLAVAKNERSGAFEFALKSEVEL